MNKVTRFSFVLLLLLVSMPALADDEFDLYKQLYQEIKPGEVEAWLKANAGLLGATPQKITKTVNGVLFDSNYDNGSLLDVTSAGANTFNLTRYTEPGQLGTYTYWFRFRMEGVAGRTLTLNLAHGENPRPVIRTGTVSWRRMTAAEAPTSSTLILSFGAGENIAEVAFFFPSGYQETFDEVARLVEGSIYASTEVIGQSFEGRDMWMVTVTDPGVPDAGKNRVWVHSRAHAGESTSTHAMLGILEQTLEDSNAGRLLRRNCIFNIVPLLNVDGVHLGHTRWDSQGLDPERQWCDYTTKTPEVANLKAQVDPFMAGPNPIRLALNLHSTQGNYSDTFFFKHLSPSVSQNFETIQQNYIDAFRNASPLFNNQNPQTSQLHACQFIESYFWNNWGESVMALTHEGHFRQRITDGEYITADDYREIGHGLALALIEYFDLKQETFASFQLY